MRLTEQRKRISKILSWLGLCIFMAQPAGKMDEIFFRGQLRIRLIGRPMNDIDNVVVAKRIVVLSEKGTICLIIVGIRLYIRRIHSNAN